MQIKNRKYQNNMKKYKYLEVSISSFSSLFFTDMYEELQFIKIKKMSCNDQDGKRLISNLMRVSNL